MRKARGKLLTIETSPGPGPGLAETASFSRVLGDDRKAINVVPNLVFLTPSDAEKIRRQVPSLTCLLLLPAVLHPLQHWWYWSLCN